METLPPLISQEESDRKRVATNSPDLSSIKSVSDQSEPSNGVSKQSGYIGEPPAKKSRGRPRKAIESKANGDKTSDKSKVQEKESSEKDDDSPGMKFVCKICSVCKRTKELIEKVIFQINSYK